MPISTQLAELAARRTDLPLSWSARGNGCWVLTEYDDISDLLRRNNRGVVSFPNEPDGTNAVGSRSAMIPIEIDGAQHRQYRRYLDPAFSPQMVGQLEDHLREQANRFIDAFIESGRCDFVEGFALPFPGATVLAIMGWPLEDLHRMNRWTATLLHGVTGGTLEENAAARGQAHVEFSAYMLEKIPEWRAAPRKDDVTSVMLDAEIDGQKMTDSELFDFFVLMMTAGLDTVQSVLAQTAVYFARNPEQWDRMFESPELLDHAIEELLRWTAPAVPTRTVTDESVDFHGVAIPRGDRIHAPWRRPTGTPSTTPIRTRSFSTGRRSRTWPSGSGRTAASGCTWPDSSSGSPTASCTGGSHGSSWTRTRRPRASTSAWRGVSRTCTCGSTPARGSSPTERRSDAAILLIL